MIIKRKTVLEELLEMNIEVAVSLNLNDEYRDINGLFRAAVEKLSIDSTDDEKKKLLHLLHSDIEGIANQAFSLGRDYERKTN